MKTPAERFWEKVNKTDDCWLWTGARQHDYGSLRHAGKASYRAHRFSYELHHGAIPDGMQVCHRCDVPLCVNPDHLFLGTNADNVADMVAKSRNHRPAPLGPDDVGPAAVLSASDVERIRAAGYTKTSVEWAAELGVHRHTIDNVRHGRAWANRPIVPLRGEPRRYSGEANAAARLSNEQAVAIRAAYEAGGATYLGLARAFGVSKATVGRIVRREKWQNVA